VQDNGTTFSISVAGSDLAADTKVHASVTATDSAGNTATATSDHAYSVDTSATASISIDSITADNIINASEAAGNVSVTGAVGGDVKAGDTVTLTVNGHDYTGAVQQGGTYAINVAGSDLAADNNVHASVTTTDAAGNTATATNDHAYSVDTSATASISIDSITADNIINASEAAGNVSVTGTVGGDVKAGDTVTLTVNGHDYTGTVQNNGTTFSISVAGSDLAADTKVHASVTATDSAGNTATATNDHTYSVDTSATAGITIDSITSDNILTAAEAAGNVNVTGTVSGDAKPGDTVTLTVNGQTYTGQVAANDTYSISVKGSDLAAVSSVHASVTATDGAGNTFTAQADHAYDNAPTAPAATTAVSEEGLTGGNPDTIGSPSDTTNSATATGQMAIGDVDHNSLLVTLTAPTATITSGGTALSWSGDGTGQIVGKAGSTTIMTVTIDNTGAYTVTLNGPIDHPDKTSEDVLGLNFGVVVSDQQGGTTNSTLTVNVEDDSPIWTGATDSALIEGFIGAELTGNLNSSLGADSGAAAKVVFSGAGMDANGNIMSTTGQYVTYNNLKLHYTDSNGALVAVASDGTQVYKISGDAHTGQYDMTMLKSLDSTMAQSVSFNAISAGANNVYTMTDTGNLYTMTITATQNGASAKVNTTSTDFGVANQWIDSGETLKFVFDQKMIGMNVTLHGQQFGTGDHVQYTVHYTDGTTGTGTINGAAGSVTANLQFTHSIDSITFSGATTSNGAAGDPYGLILNSITGTTTKLDQAIQFNAAVVDSDGDTTSNHVVTATLSYDGSMAAGSGSTAMGGATMAETLTGSSSDDIITGGGGNDTMAGGLGADTFVWHFGDKGTAGTPAVDKITDFGTAAYTAGGSGDRLDLRDLLQGESQSGGNLTNYLHFEKVGSDTVVHVSSSGGFANGYSAGAEDQKIVLAGVDLAAMYNANSDAAIIQNLLANHKLVTD
jgi:T1SS-143 domain-containing protein